MAAATILVLFFGHISVANEDICVKCGRQIDTGYVRVAMGQNATFGKIQHGGPAILKLHKLLRLRFGFLTLSRSTMKLSIFVKFGAHTAVRPKSHICKVYDGGDLDEIWHADRE